MKALGFLRSVQQNAITQPNPTLAYLRIASTFFFYIYKLLFRTKNLVTRSSYI